MNIDKAPYENLAELLCVHQSAVKTCDLVLADPISPEETAIIQDLKLVYKAAATTIISEMDRRADLIPFCLIIKMLH